MIDGISLIGLTPPGLLLVVVIMVLTGRLIPRRIYLDKAKEADQWHQAYEAMKIARDASDAQTSELLEVAKASRQFLEGVYTNSELLKSGES
jgi:hypothetical protein